MAVNVNGGALEFDAVINAEQFNRAISSIEKQLAGITQTANKEASAIDGLMKKTTAAIATYASFTAGSGFVTDIVRVRGEFQQLEVAFSTMLGSKEKADKLLAEVTNFAATTPFELQEVAGATKQLLAFGISAEDIIPTLRSLGDVSAGLGQPVGEIAYLFGTIKTQGVAMTQDIRQFASRGIPIYEELAKILGVGTDKVNEFITAGKIGFPQIEQVFKNLTAEGGKFGGLMEAQSKTLTGQISNLRDAWTQMLNTIGKGQEGLFSDIINGATLLVKNFDTVLDILQVLIITYGAYKAAVIATAAVQAIATAATKGYTIAETLRYQAMLLSERAMKILNATMLKNPAVAIATGVTLLVSALVLFNRRASEAKSKSELLAAAQEKVGDKLSETRAKIEPYLNALKNANLSEADRLRIYNELVKIDPQIVAGLNAKTISYEGLKKNVDAYLGSLRKQIALEANKEALQASIRLEQELEKKIKTNNKLISEDNKLIDERNRRARELGAPVAGGETVGLNNLRIKETQQLTKDLEAQKKTSEELGAVEVENLATKKQTSDADKNSIKTTKEKNKGEGDYNDLLEKRKSLLEVILDLDKQSQNLNRTKEQTELDRINEKYDAIIKNITEYNKKVDEYNAKNKNKQVAKVGQQDIQKLNDARSRELDDTRLKQQADAYIANLEKQADAFRKFEEAKKQVGVEKAKELFGEQTGQYQNFLELLRSQLTEILPKITLGIANVGEVNKFKAIVDQINQYNKQKNEEQIEEEKQKFLQLLEVTATYNQQKAQINRKYDDLETSLKKNSTVGELDERQKLLDQARQEELDALNSLMARSSALYKKLNQDIISFTRERLKQEVKLLQEQLKKNTGLTPQQKADIQGTIDQYKSLLDATNDIAQDFSKAGEALSAIGGSFSNLSSSLEGVDDKLSGILDTLSSIASIGSSAANAIASFAAGDIIGGITNTINVIAGLFSLGKKAREERRKQQQEIQEFYTRIFSGEQEINRLYRERALEQVRINKLRIQGIEDEKILLEAQKIQVKNNYDSVFAELQKLTARVRRQIGLGFSGFAGESLFGKSFEQLEEFYLKGQLEGKAKELFEQLQRLKQEGVDIDKALEAAKQEAQELFTGTTADSISDAIINGFLEGKRGAADFASTFEDLMRGAMINSLKYKYLEGPIKEFFEQFAAASESDGQLTNSEIATLESTFNTILGNAQQQFQQLQQIAGLNFNSTTGGQPNSLTGAIKGITEQQAELLAGQFGGMRITMIDILGVSRQQLNALNAIQVNTGTAALRLQTIIDKMIYYYETRGVKIF